MEKSVEVTVTPIQRDTLRSMTVGAPAVRKTVTVLFKEQEFDLKAPTVAERSLLIEKASVEGDKVKVNTGEMLVQCVLTMVYVPGTDTLVFEPGDHDRLMNEPAGGFVDVLGQEAMKLVNVKETVQENFGSPQNGDSSSKSQGK